jgi:chitodextrinase
MTALPRLFVAGPAVLILAMLAGQSTAYAADRSAPSTPTNLRVTAVTAYTVSLTWTASRDKSGIASYTICCANVSSQKVDGSATSATYTKGLEPGRSFTLFIVAVDNAGNYSKNSNTVTFTTLRDTTSPTKPTVAVTDLGPSHVSLAWSATDDGPNLWFTVFKDGGGVLDSSRETSSTFGPLRPETTYTFTVQARDFSNHLSPMSDPVTVTTPARETADTTAPSTPGNFNTRGMNFSDGETWLFWDASTDDQDPASVIVYEIFINGVFDSGTVGYTQTVVYGPPFSENTYSVVAVDASGNRSAPATILVDNR